MGFLREAVPRRDTVIDIAPRIRRLTAPNAGPMTYHGTNSYIIDYQDGYAIVDPGPAQADDHLACLIEACRGSLRAIVITHGHQDHFGALQDFPKAARPPIYGFESRFNPDWRPEHLLNNGDSFGAYKIIHTPGHAPDHICLARDDGVVLTGDHVMGWSSTVVSPLTGDMAAYLASLQLLRDRGDRLYLPGHGPALPNPTPYIDALIAKRLKREAQILQAISKKAASASELAQRLYAKADPKLQDAAERNANSHLLKLQNEGQAFEANGIWSAI